MHDIQSTIQRKKPDLELQAALRNHFAANGTTEFDSNKCGALVFNITEQKRGDQIGIAIEGGLIPCQTPYNAVRLALSAIDGLFGILITLNLFDQKMLEIKELLQVMIMMKGGEADQILEKLSNMPEGDKP